MKKYLVLLILLAFSAVGWGAISIHRDFYHDHRWSVYIPAQNGYTTRFDFAISSTDAQNANHMALQGAYFGKLRPGKAYRAEDMTQATGTWVAAVLSTYWSIINPTALASGEAKLTCSIPQNYDYIIAYLQDNKSYSFKWSDGTTTGIVAAYAYPTFGLTDIANSASFGQVVIATNCGAKTTAGAVTLELYVNATSARVGGIHAFDSDGTGDLAAATGGIATGHDLILGASTIFSTTVPTFASVNKDAWQILNQVNSEFAISTSADGGTPEWTSLSGHYGAGNAEYVDKTTNGIVIKVDGVAKSNCYVALATTPHGTLYSGSVIDLVYSGWFDWDDDGNENATEPDYAGDTILTIKGLWHNGLITFNANAEVTDFYSGMVGLAYGVQTFTVKNLINTNLYTVNSPYSDGSQNYQYIAVGDRLWAFPSGNDKAIVNIFTPMACDNIVLRYGSSVSVYPKAYLDVDCDVLPGATTKDADTVDVVSGSLWPISTFIEVSTRQEYPFAKSSGWFSH